MRPGQNDGLAVRAAKRKAVTTMTIAGARWKPRADGRAFAEQRLKRPEHPERGPLPPRRGVGVVDEPEAARHQPPPIHAFGESRSERECQIANHAVGVFVLGRALVRRALRRKDPRRTDG